MLRIPFILLVSFTGFSFVSAQSCRSEYIPEDDFDLTLIDSFFKEIQSGKTILSNKYLRSVDIQNFMTGMSFETLKTGYAEYTYFELCAKEKEQYESLKYPHQGDMNTFEYKRIKDKYDEDRKVFLQEYNTCCDSATLLKKQFVDNLSDLRAPELQFYTDEIIEARVVVNMNHYNFDKERVPLTFYFQKTESSLFDALKEYSISEAPVLHRKDSNRGVYEVQRIVTYTMSADKAEALLNRKGETFEENIILSGLKNKPYYVDAVSKAFRMKGSNDRRHVGKHNLYYLDITEEEFQAIIEQIFK